MTDRLGVMTTPQGGGYLHMLPTVLPRGMSATGISAAMLPWLAPSYAGVIGTSQDTPPEPALAVTFEWPLSWLRTVNEIPKFDREFLCIRRFSSDQALAMGSHAWANIRPGSDPPDTLVATDRGDLGVELTSLTLQDRRTVHSLFGLLRRRVLEHEPAVFSHLAGTLVYIWFEEPGGAELTMPFRRTDTVAVDEVIRELAGYQPDLSRMWLPTGPPPQQAPPLPLTTTPAGAKFYAIPLVMSAPSTMFFTMAGFELGLAYTSFLTVTTAWNEVQRLVDDHDKPGVYILLIMAGAPNQRGDIFPAEEAVAAFIAEHPRTLSRNPRYIKRVMQNSP
jgi:hypothetical protein